MVAMAKAEQIAQEVHAWIYIISIIRTREDTNSDDDAA